MKAGFSRPKEFYVDFTRTDLIFLLSPLGWSGLGHLIYLAAKSRMQQQRRGGLHGLEEPPMPRHKEPEGGFADPTSQTIGQFLDGDDELEREILELMDQLSVLKRRRHDHRNKIIVDLKLFTPPIEAAKKFAASHTPFQCRMDVIGRFLTYRQLGIFSQSELFDDPVIKQLESCMTNEAA